MNGDGGERAPGRRPPAGQEDFAAIPILLDPVRESPAAGDAAPAGELPDEHQDRRPLGRADQQSLFDDITAGASDTPPASPATATTKPARRPPPATGLQRMAENLLRARAPAIIDELVDAQAQQLSAALRERLRAELVTLLAELAADDNIPPGPR